MKYGTLLVDYLQYKYSVNHLIYRLSAVTPVSVMSGTY